MISVSGKFLRKHRLLPKQLPGMVLPLSFFLIEVLAFCFLSAPEGQRVLSLSSWTSGKLGADALWPLAFGLLWAVMLTSLLRLLPRKAARIGYGICYFLFLIYALIQTGYFLLFREMIWISDFRYASEGASYSGRSAGIPPELVDQHPGIFCTWHCDSSSFSVHSHRRKIPDCSVAVRRRSHCRGFFPAPGSLSQRQQHSIRRFRLRTDAVCGGRL